MTLSRLEIMDAAALRPLLKLAKQGDLHAARDLHSMLAVRLRAGEITPTLCAILADMHDNAAAGAPMIAPTPQSRPPDLRKNERIYFDVRWTLDMYDHIDANHGRTMPTRPTLAGIYRQVAAKLGLAESTVKNVYLLERRARGK